MLQLNKNIKLYLNVACFALFALQRDVLVKEKRDVIFLSNFSIFFIALCSPNLTSGRPLQRINKC